MKKSQNMKQLVSKKIVEMSMDIVKNTVGKSYPAFVHEVKMPEEVKDAFLNNQR